MMSVHIRLGVRKFFHDNPALSTHAGLVLCKDDLFKITDVVEVLSAHMWRNPAAAGASAVMIGSFIDPASGSLLSLAEFYQIVGHLGNHKNAPRFRNISKALLEATGDVKDGGNYSGAALLIGDFLLRSAAPTTSLDLTPTTVFAAAAVIKFRLAVTRGEASYVHSYFSALLADLPNLRAVVGDVAGATAGVSPYDLAVQLMHVFVPSLSTKKNITVADAAALEWAIHTPFRRASAQDGDWATHDGTARVASVVKASLAHTSAAAGLPKMAKAQRLVTGNSTAGLPFGALVDSHKEEVAMCLSSELFSGRLVFTPPSAGDQGFQVRGAPNILREALSGVLSLVDHYVERGEPEHALRTVFESGQALLIQYVISDLQIAGAPGCRSPTPVTHARNTYLTAS